MKRLLTLCLILVGLTTISVTTSRATESSSQPRLVVNIVVGSMRGDDLDRYAANLTENGFRRIMREGLRALEREKALKTGFLIVIAARSASVKLKSGEIKRQLDSAFTKLGMFN